VFHSKTQRLIRMDLVPIGTEPKPNLRKFASH